MSLTMISLNTAKVYSSILQAYLVSLNGPQADLQHTSEFNIMDLAELLMDGKKVEAIKQLRENTKQAIQVQIPTNLRNNHATQLLAVVEQLSKEGRNHHGTFTVCTYNVALGLKEAKDFIDLLQTKLEN